MTFEEAVAKVEAAGLFWAIEGGPGYGYYAAVQGDDKYIGDQIHYRGVEGSTAAEALLNALADFQNRQ